MTKLIETTHPVNHQAPGSFPFAFKALIQSGWMPGVPQHISPETRAVDEAGCRAMKCPACGRKGLAYRPFHRRDGNRYKVLAACPRCNAVEEV